MTAIPLTDEDALIRARFTTEHLAGVAFSEMIDQLNLPQFPGLTVALWRDRIDSVHRLALELDPRAIY